MSASRGIEYRLEQRVRDQIRRERAENQAAKVDCWTTQREAADCAIRLESLAKKAGYGSLNLKPIPAALETATRGDYETQTRALREQILDMESRWRALSRPQTTPLRAGNETPTARVERYLGQLDPTAIVDDSMLQLCHAVDGATLERGHTLADRLQLLVGQANRTVSRQRANETQLNELASRIEALPSRHPELHRLLGLAHEAVALGGPLDGRQLRIELERAEADAEEEAERIWVADVVQNGLEKLGYTVSTGYGTIFPAADGLVRRTIWNHHALSVGVSSGEVSLEIVRTADEEQPSLAAVRDREVETSWCKDFPLLLAHLTKKGVVPARVRAVPAGLSRSRLVGDGKLAPKPVDRPVPWERAKK